MANWIHRSRVLHQIVNNAPRFRNDTSTIRISLVPLDANRAISFTFHRPPIMSSSSNGHQTSRPASNINPAHEQKSLSTPPPTPNHDHDHTHPHSMFGLHSHERENAHGAENVMKALRGTGDRGSQITLIGLIANIFVTSAKGAAGWFLHSASLLADAGHSLSDLLGDFVTLVCWKLSRKPPSPRYPYGFAKFETLGTTTVSLLLIGGALGIGFHSYQLLLHALADTASTLPADSALRHVLQTLSSLDLPSTAAHAHAHGALDPNAAWFAALSIVAKEWLYRITKTVADAEKSPVLLANAIHHRSDAYSSVVALVAILGSTWFPAIPLDPLGGFVVSLVILHQGWGILLGAWGQLTDKGVSVRTRDALVRALDPLLLHKSSNDGEIRRSRQLRVIRDLRARRAGSLMFVDLTVDVDGTLSVSELCELEREIDSTLRRAKTEIAEVRVRFRDGNE